MKVNTTTANPIREARDRKKWSQIYTASKLGVHVVTYQLWERDAGKPNQENQQKLIDILGVDPDKLREWLNRAR